MVRKDLAQTLRRIATQGRDGFYKGGTAENLVRFLDRSGGIMDATDLAEFMAEETRPLHVRYRGYDVYGVGLPTQSPVMLETLKILEGYSLKAMGHNSADYIHHVTEALKLAFADREAYIGDPRFVKNIPIDTLLSETYAARRRALIRKDRAIDGVASPGLGASTLPVYAKQRGSHVELQGAAAFPDWVESFTTHIDAVDKEHNMVTITSSVASDFGSAMYVDGEGGGYFLNDALARFHLDPKHPERRGTAEAAATDFESGAGAEGWKAFYGVRDSWRRHAGTIATAVLPQLRRIWDERATGAGAALFRNRSIPSVVRSHPAGKGLSVSQRIPREVREDLAKRGHDVRTHSAKGVGSVKAIVVDANSGVLMGGAAPATDSAVVGW